MKPRNRRSRRVGGILLAPPPLTPVFRPEPVTRRVTVGGRVYASMDADSLLDWLGEEPSSAGFIR